MNTGTLSPLRLGAWCMLVSAYHGTPSAALAQRIAVGSWNVLNVKHEHSDKLTFLVEGQIRSLGFYNTFHYHEVKAALSYKVIPALRIGIGVGRYDTYAETGDFARPQQNSELRIWPHATMESAFGLVKVEHRYRAEMRWTSNGYRNRFRYRLGLSYAFGQESNGQRPFQLSANNELFFTEREPYFERNRMAFTLNHRIGLALVVQTGYLHQFDYRINDETGRDFLIIGLFIELPNRRAGPKDDPPVQPTD